MKVVNKEELFNYPTGTVYSDYSNGVIDGLYIKTKSFDNDWHIIDILDPEFNGEPYNIIDSLEKGNNIPYILSKENNSNLNNFENMFIIYDDNDVSIIIKALQSTIK